MRAYALIVILCLAPLLAGCGKKEYKQPGYGIATVPYHEQTLQSLTLSRQYMAQGRYELAKQRLLLALAVERDSGMRARLSEELASVDKMIQTLR
jgi:hypothetical protein